MAQHMGIDPPVDTGSSGVFLQYPLYPPFHQSPAATVNEQGRVPLPTQQLSPALADVGNQGCRGRPAHQHHPLPGALSPDPDFIGVKVDLIDIQVYQLAYP